MSGKKKLSAVRVKWRRNREKVKRRADIARHQDWRETRDLF